MRSLPHSNSLEGKSPTSCISPEIRAPCPSQSSPITRRSNWYYAYRQTVCLWNHPSFGDTMEQSGFLMSTGTPIKNGQQINGLPALILLPSEISVKKLGFALKRLSLSIRETPRLTLLQRQQ